MKIPFEFKNSSKLFISNSIYLKNAPELKAKKTDLNVFFFLSGVHTPHRCFSAQRALARTLKLLLIVPWRILKLLCQ